MLIEKLIRTCNFFARASMARSCLIKSNNLIKQGNFKDALIEAKKARDEKSATAYEIKLAKGQIVEILNSLKKENKSENNGLKN